MKYVRWTIRFINAIILTIIYAFGKAEQMFKPKKDNVRKIHVTFTERLAFMQKLKNDKIIITTRE